MDLTYSSAFHGRCMLDLVGGRSVKLDQLQQILTYSSMLEGLPSTSSNDWLIQQMLGRANALCLEGASAQLVPPVRRDFLKARGDMSSRSGSRVPAFLPMVCCIARLTDTAPRTRTDETRLDADRRVVPR